MKFSIIAAVGAVCVFSTSALHAQSATARSTQRGRTTTTTSIIKGPSRRPIITNTPPTVTVTPGTDGVIPRAIRSGSPLQMINPLAPAAYGNGQDTTRRELGDPYARPQGIKLVTFEF